MQTRYGHIGTKESQNMFVTMFKCSQGEAPSYTDLQLYLQARDTGSYNLRG